MKSTSSLLLGMLLLTGIQLVQHSQPSLAQRNCDPSYPDFCIAPGLSDLDCKDIQQRNFRVLPPDPHGFDGDRDGIGCEQRQRR